MSGGIFLIVNADDFGRSAGINEGVIRAHEQGILTSASLMVRWPSAEPAAAYARRHPALSLGLHVDFGEWVFRAGEWSPIYAVVDRKNHAAIEQEIHSQLSVFRELVGRDPTHVDSHQHVHRKQPANSLLPQIIAELGVPVRERDTRVRYCGTFYGQEIDGTPRPERITPDALIGILRRLHSGITELGCHPAAIADMEGMYRGERLQELETLCDPRARAVIDERGIHLCSFACLERALQTGPERS